MDKYEELEFIKQLELKDVEGTDVRLFEGVVSITPAITKEDGKICYVMNGKLFSSETEVNLIREILDRLKYLEKLHNSKSAPVDEK